MDRMGCIPILLVNVMVTVMVMESLGANDP